jgi:hypothetical protein
MRKSLLAVLAFPLLAVGGCAVPPSGYAVDARNRSAQPISLELLSRDAQGNLYWLAQPVRLGPGDRGGVGPASLEAGRSALLRTDTPGNPGRPVMTDLWPGATVVEVTQDGELANSPLRVTVVR